MATIEGCDIRIVKGGVLYPLRLQKIVKNGVAYPIAQGTNSFGIVKDGNLYVMSPRKYNPNQTARTLRSAAVPAIPVNVTIVKLAKNGDPLSRDLSVRINNENVYSLSGFQNAEDHYLCDVTLGGQCDLYIINTGIQSFVLSSIQLISEGAVLASLDNIEGIYESGESRTYGIDLTGCPPWLPLTIKINIHD